MKLALPLFTLLISASTQANDFAVLREAIAQTWQPDGVHVIWEPLFGDPAIMADWSDVRVESEMPECALGLLTITFSGKKPDGTSVRATFKGRARIFGECWTVASRINSGTPIREENLVRLTAELTNLRTTALRDLTSIVNKLSVRSLVPSRPILRSDVREAPVIRSGEPVSIVYRRGHISVILDGIAMMDGGVGEQIPVRVPEIHKNRLKGVIQDDHTLRWVP